LPLIKTVLRGKNQSCATLFKRTLINFFTAKTTSIVFQQHKEFPLCCKFPSGSFQTTALNANTLVECNNAETLERKNVLKENIALIIQTPYK